MKNNKCVSSVNLTQFLPQYIPKVINISLLYPSDEDFDGKTNLFFIK